MRVHFLASMPHYRRHIYAVWRHLPDDLRGLEGTPKDVEPDRDDVWMVGGFPDIGKVPKHRIIYVEHGAGQAYHGDRDSAGHQSYHGSRHPARVIGYISPRQDVADSWGRPAFAAGCPLLELVDRRSTGEAVIAFHWDAWAVSPEARTARPHYLDELHTIVGWARNHRYRPVGCWHPRDRRGDRYFRNLGIPVTDDPLTVLECADLLLCDNSSLMYEAAALGIRVIAMNAPWYRRNIHHGLRFWDHVPGPQVDHPMDVLSINPDDQQWRRRADELAASATAYAYGDNPGGEAAAKWVTELVNAE